MQCDTSIEKVDFHASEFREAQCILTAGVDLAKKVFALYGESEAGKLELPRPSVQRAKPDALITAGCGAEVCLTQDGCFAPYLGFAALDKWGSPCDLA